MLFLINLTKDHIISSHKAMAPLLFLLITLSLPLSVPCSSTNSNSTEFIRLSCSATLYPKLCFHSLSGYASTVQQDPVQLAKVSASITFAHVSKLSSHISTLCRTPAARLGNREMAALHDCDDALGDAVDLTQRSVDEIAKLETAVGTEVAWRVSNAQTWMSAAITNEDTCGDGFDGMVPSPVKRDVCTRVKQAKQYTSNTLALVNSLVASR